MQTLAYPSLSSKGKDLTYRTMLTLYMIFIFVSLASFMWSYPHAMCSSSSGTAPL